MDKGARNFNPETSELFDDILNAGRNLNLTPSMALETLRNVESLLMRSSKAKEFRYPLLLSSTNFTVTKPEPGVASTVTVSTFIAQFTFKLLKDIYNLEALLDF